ncbi:MULTISPECIES: hypothetical protein [Parachlamydia]|jgi:hypothetical protein|uniref:BioF2-like acetyltransferase domain-containing protein n=2 Tax=Parachlamydia acanthamoebae TaxID=83552 RepID=F8KWT7_PARAV|nr:hypothetical protein [Parachlamydia acanthamoebae]EFB41741.1 hypothetical protein pah_c022o007 [Parachlamydia acanthamoebae str. Hall's coccus]KIA77920.1 hypothetical protein DB43_FK00250 [Parachlamydia acanthamoebae]CCB86376.1 putative uncharacterized protein [Parachlamydia acanthamoebae UV-7]
MSNSQNSIQVFNSKTIDQLIWPATPDGEYARKFLTPLVTKGVSHYIDNIDAEMQILKVNDHILPLVVTQNSYTTSYVCSPYGHYISYASQSLHLIEGKWIQSFAKNALNGFGKILKAGKINKVVYVNNWLFSTDLYATEFTPQEIDLISNTLKNLFPLHAIAFRSINSYTNAQSLQALKDNAFDMIVSRQVFLTDTKNEQVFKTRIFKSDLKLMRESEYEILNETQLADEEYERVLHLYRELYIDKYSELNPQLNLQFLKYLISEGLMHFRVLKKDGRIDGVVGYYIRNGLMTSPFFGYDSSLPTSTGLYRLLSTILSLEAKEKGLILHQSSGASFYKKVRRAESYLEYMAVYARHLPYGRKIPWFLLKHTMNSVAIPFMEKY